MTVILGIDPGSRITGYGVIEVTNKSIAYIDSGCVRTIGADFGSRLHEIFTGITDVIKLYQPQEAAIEQVFMHRNASSALKLGQARGAAITAVKQFSLSVAEYAPRLVKQSVVGYGAATKVQVQQMIVQLLQLSKTPQADAADALAIALCHANTRKSLLTQKLQQEQVL